MTTRREVLAGAALSLVATTVGAKTTVARPADRVAALRRAPFRQGLTRYSLGAERSVEECCRVAVELGAQGLDFYSNPADWPTLKKYGLVCSMARADFGGGHSEAKRVQEPPGWNAIGMQEAQGAFLAEFHRVIDLCADAGVPNLILLAGTRHTVTYEQGADNAVAFCNAVKAHAEDRGVTLCMEFVNSKMIGGPPLSLFDRSAWGFDVVKRVNSPRVKVLYDIFHAQLMEGNVVATIRENIGLIGHIHVGGVPGRHELDGTQELNYAFIGRAIAATSYTGFVTHEWGPSPGVDPLDAVRRSMDILVSNLPAKG